MIANGLIHRLGFHPKKCTRAIVFFTFETPIVAAQKIEEDLGLPAGSVTAHVMQGGGSFGRRLFFDGALAINGSARVPAIEVLVTTGRARDMIVDSDATGRLHEIIRDGDFYGMQTFDQSLFDHVSAERISLEAALEAASSPHDFKLMLDSGAARRTSAMYSS